MSSASLPTSTEIYVNALLKKLKDDPSDPDKWANYFASESTVFHYEHGNWNGKEGPELYPTSGTIRFAAYACDFDTCRVINDLANPGTQLTIDEKNARKPVATWAYDANGDYKSLNLKFGSKPLEGQTDVMVATPLNVNVVSATTPTQTLTFNHTQAWVKVLLSKGSSTIGGGDSYKFFGISLVDTYMSGELTYDFQAAAGDQPASWTMTENDKVDDTLFPTYYDCDVDDDRTGITFDDLPKDPVGILVMPQAQTKIKILYKMKIGSTYGPLQEKILDLSAYGDWEIGKMYQYSITVSPTEITFNCNVNNTFGVAENQNDEAIGI